MENGAKSIFIFQMGQLQHVCIAEVKDPTGLVLIINIHQNVKNSEI